MDAITNPDEFFARIEARRQAIRDRFWPDEKVAKLKEMHAANAAYGVIANALGVTRNAVCGKIKRLGMSVPMSVRFGPEFKSKRQQKPGWVRFKAKVRPERVALFEKFPVADPSLDLESRTDLSCEIVGLTQENCHWPVGDVGSESFFFCGQEAIKGRPYCGAHCRIAYEPRKGARPRFRSHSGNHFVGRSS